MKELVKGVLSVIFSIIVFTPVIAVGVLFNLIYPFYMGLREKSVLKFFQIMWRLFDGTLATIGNFLYDGFSIHYDELGNVWGEWLEDSLTTEEDTQFGEKNMTISASIGHLEKEDLPLFKRGKKLSKILNVVFREKRHCLGSWEKFLEYEKIRKKNLKGKR